MTGIPESLTFGFQIPVMIVRQKILVFFVLFCLLAGCRHKKKLSLAGEDPVDVSDFIAFFHPVQLPYQAGDSILAKKNNDSLLISYKVFTQFVPDTLVSKLFGKGVKPKIYPMGKFSVPKGDSYLFVKAVTPVKKAAYLLSFSNKDEFVAGMAVLRTDQAASAAHLVTLDKRLTITKTALRKNRDGSTSEGKDVFVLNSESKSFTLIMTDPLDDKVTELINPIDTLPRRNKLSADYAAGKLNMVSIRDAKKADRFRFFIHFEKNNNECNGELKGEAIMKSSSLAEYSENGDPCKLKFIFTATSVTLKEGEGCGSHRGLRCSFDGSFARKKYVKPAIALKQPVKK